MRVREGKEKGMESRDPAKQTSAFDEDGRAAAREYTGITNKGEKRRGDEDWKGRRGEEEEKGPRPRRLERGGSDLPRAEPDAKSLTENTRPAGTSAGPGALTGSQETGKWRWGNRPGRPPSVTGSRRMRHARPPGCVAGTGVALYQPCVRWAGARLAARGAGRYSVRGGSEQGGVRGSTLGWQLRGARGRESHDEPVSFMGRAQGDFPLAMWSFQAMFGSRYIAGAGASHEENVPRPVQKKEQHQPPRLPRSALESLAPRSQASQGIAL